MSNCCDTEYSINWGRNRCTMSRSLRYRAIVINDNSNQCTSPFTENRNKFNVIDYFPVTYIKYSVSSEKIQTNNGTCSIVTDNYVSTDELLNNLLIVINNDSRSLVITSKITNIDIFSKNDCDIRFTLERNKYSYDELFN